MRTMGAPAAQKHVSPGGCRGQLCIILVADWAQREFYVFNHLEYDRETLKTEYERDLAKGASIHMPLNYFPDDNPKHSPPNMWRAFAAVVFQNWLNFVYQGTPYDLNTLNEAVHETFHKTGV